MVTTTLIQLLKKYEFDSKGKPRDVCILKEGREVVDFKDVLLLDVARKGYRPKIVDVVVEGCRSTIIFDVSKSICY